MVLHVSLRPGPMLHVHNVPTMQDCSLNQTVMWYLWQLILYLAFRLNFYYLQASGPLLPQLALGHPPVLSSPSLLLMTTRQCYLEETNHDLPQCLKQRVNKEAESMTVFLWILSQWYAQTDSALIQICITLQSYSSTLKIYLCYFNPVWSPQLHSFCVLDT